MCAEDVLVLTPRVCDGRVGVARDAIVPLILLRLRYNTVPDESVVTSGIKTKDELLSNFLVIIQRIWVMSRGR